MMGTRSEKRVIMWCHRSGNPVEGIHTDLDEVAYYTPGLCGTAYWSSAQQHKVKSSARENDVIKRRGKLEMCEAAAGITWDPVLQQTLFW